MKRELWLVPIGELDGDAPGPGSPALGIERGIPALRAVLDEIRGRASKDPWPLTWLVRADPTVAAERGDAGYWRTLAADVLAKEEDAGAEIGWWFRRAEAGPDELALLAGCLARLRAHGPVAAVRARGVYSRELAEFLGAQGLPVDASPEPGAPGWEGCPRLPYRGLPAAPTRPAGEGRVMVPRLAEALPGTHSLVRFAFTVLANPKAALSPGRTLARASWQGVGLDAPRRLFERAVCQVLGDLPGPRWVVAAAFPTGALADPEGSGTVAGNIESVRRLADQAEARFAVKTLSALARYVEPSSRS